MDKELGTSPIHLKRMVRDEIRSVQVLDIISSSRRRIFSEINEDLDNKTVEKNGTHAGLKTANNPLSVQQRLGIPLQGIFGTCLLGEHIAAGTYCINLEKNATKNKSNHALDQLSFIDILNVPTMTDTLLGCHLHTRNELGKKQK
jgi:hypothetical protein